jgi:hypothetical protein
MKPSEPQLVFIVGMSRAGTTWMSNCLGRHPDISTFGESMFWGRKYIHPSKDGTYTRDQCHQIVVRLKGKGIIGHGIRTLRNVTRANISDVLDEAFAKIESPVTPGDLYKQICKTIAEKEGKVWLIEKTPHHLNWADRIKEAIPDARFIVMYREPYSFMLSYKHQPDRQKINDEKKRTMKRLYHPIGCALVWRGYARSVGYIKEKYPESVCLAPFQEVHERPENLLDTVQLFLGVQPCKDIYTRSVNTSFHESSRPTLSSDDMFWMNCLARKEILTSGFEIKQFEYDWPRIIRSFLQIPLWMFHVAWNMRNEVEGSLLAFLRSWVVKKSILKSK